jgi:outer membrane protein
VLEAEAGLAMRRSLVSEARQAIDAAQNSVRTFLSSPAGEANGEFQPTEPLTVSDRTPDFTGSLARSFKLRAEYLASRRKIAREDIRLVFAENQSWPQLDLKGSYNMNGLADSPDRSFNDSVQREHETWSVGFELRIPLEGDKKGQSELQATRQRKRQALLEFKAVEVSLTNAVDTAVKGVRHVREQVRQVSGIVDMNRRLLAAEIAKFEAGKSNSRILLGREEELNKALEAQIEAVVKYRKAMLQLEFAEGALLANHGVDIMEAGLQ